MMYKTPLGIIAAPYKEVLPLGTVVALVSALILRHHSSKLSGYSAINGAFLVTGRGSDRHGLINSDVFTRLDKIPML